MAKEQYDPVDLVGQEQAIIEGKRLQKHERAKEV